MATDAEAGRSCPYCRFALKAGVPVERCSACEAVHHEDCWHDGGGCSIFGCPSAGTATMPAAPPPPVTGKQVVAGPDEPAPPPPPQSRPSSAPRATLVAAIALLLVLVAGLAGYLVTSGTGDDPPVADANVGTESAAVDGPAAVEEPTVAPEEETTPEPTPDPQVEAKRHAERIAEIVEFSLEGRSAVREGRYGEAVDNRRKVLRRLGAIRGATGGVARAKRTLQRAMRASLNADIAYQNGTDASAYDAEASRYKERFVDDWAAVAAEHGLSEYAPGDI